MNVLSIYCDGSSNGRADGAGGWSFVILRGSQPLSCEYGGWPVATNNQMELQAAIEGLRKAATLKQDGDYVELVSDSKYTLGMASGEYQPSPGKNEEQCQLLRKLAKDLRASVRWVRGHDGDEFNERCDRLAKMGKDAANARRG